MKTFKTYANEELNWKGEEMPEATKDIKKYTVADFKNLVEKVEGLQLQHLLSSFIWMILMQVEKRGQ